MLNFKLIQATHFATTTVEFTVNDCLIEVQAVSGGICYNTNCIWINKKALECNSAFQRYTKEFNEKNKKDFNYYEMFYNILDANPKRLSQQSKMNRIKILNEIGISDLTIDDDLSTIKDFIINEMNKVNRKNGLKPLDIICL
ncbi:hypothetical protein CEP49_06680 [Mergibacter septicus]|uniref:hypothetical protein n=1 Tax=Mergibacter septicus TaxID=221402 RepID=UPI0011791784|nr:hypothetical protein [Mergibacter septicus]AWX14256.1 hypothetical protein CEP49_06680 [Mergibacter septicus]